MKTAFNTLDVVRYNATALTDNTNIHAKEYIGIVREPSDKFSYIEWYDAKSKESTREITTLHGWVENSQLDRVGSLYHLLATPTNVLMDTVKKAKAVREPVAEVQVERTKRKYTRKPGSAKPGPKPKKDKVDKPLAAKPKKVSVDDLFEPIGEMIKEGVEPVKPVEKDKDGNVLVPMPMNKFGKIMDNNWLTCTSMPRYVMATGKFKHFKTRDMIESSIREAGGHPYHNLNYNLDLVIVGEKPGPSKIKKFEWMNVAMITEEQWLAMIGAPGFKFSTEIKNANKIPDHVSLAA